MIKIRIPHSINFEDYRQQQMFNERNETQSRATVSWQSM